MPKKKQPDFQPTKLRVGKHLPKGRNVTNTSFKSKKIVTKDQKLKTSDEKTSLTDLLQHVNHNNVAIKTDALKKVVRYIELNDSDIPAYFSEILSKMSNLFLDFHPKVRQEAINVIKISSQFLTGPQMYNFMNILNSHLSCMMTHINISIKKDSLDLLSFLLMTHPNLFCRSTKLLTNLLNMISSVKVHRGESSPNQKKRKLDDNISTTMTSVEWRNQVLKLITEFLEKLVDIHAEQKLPDEDEQKVYCDGKTPLYIQLYRGGGLKPRKLKLSSEKIKSKSSVTEELESIFVDLTNVASDMLTEEMAGLNLSAHNNILHPINIEHLRSVTQVLCCIADWYDDAETLKPGKEFKTLMNRILHQKLMKGFIYKTHESGARKVGDKNKLSCMHLNLDIAYLYCTFVLGTEYNNTQLENSMIEMLAEEINQSYGQNAKAISRMLKILNHFIRISSNCTGKEMHKVNAEAISSLFEHLCKVAGKTKDEVLKKDIHTFFIKVSLEFDYKFLLDRDFFEDWMEYTAECFKKMNKTKNIDKPLLKCINQMCSREYAGFIEKFNPLESEIVGYLELDDEDYQWTVINIIVHMKNLSQDFLRIAAETILVNHNISADVICRLIQSLFIRFTDKRVSVKEFEKFISFILNVAFDVESVTSTMNKFTEQGLDQEKDGKDEYSPDFLQTLFHVQSPYHYVIIPSHQWERHSEILDACLDCLVTHRDRSITMNATTEFFLELMSMKRIFPLHSAIALLRLANDVFMFDDEFVHTDQALTFSSELTCCGLFYVSVVIHKERPELFASLRIDEIQKAFYLDPKKASFLSERMVARLFDAKIDMEMLLHVLRILKFFKMKNLVSTNDILKFGNLFKSVESYCPEDSEPRHVLSLLYELL